MSATQRTKKQLEADGWMVDVVEQWKPYSNKRKDLYGFLDMLAVCPGRILGIQVTTESNHAARRKKILGERRSEAQRWIEAGGEIEVWSWRQRPKRCVDGTMSITKYWSPRIEPITGADLQ